MDKPEIEYPCAWTFKIIGQDEGLLRKAVIETLKSRDHTVNNSNSSSGGKYISLSLTVTVDNETDRNDIYNSLQSEPTIKMIL